MKTLLLFLLVLSLVRVGSGGAALLSNRAWPRSAAITKTGVWVQILGSAVMAAWAASLLL